MAAPPVSSSSSLKVVGNIECGVPAAAAAPSGGDDTMAKLQKLADMKSQGLLSDQEFAAMKAKLLGI